MMNPSRSPRRTDRPRAAPGAVRYLRVVDEPDGDTADGGHGAGAHGAGDLPSPMYEDWESVYRDNVDRLYRLMYARVGNRADAEDLTAETFSAALRPMRLPSSHGEVRAYLLQTAK